MAKTRSDSNSKNTAPATQIPGQGDVPSLRAIAKEAAEDLGVLEATKANVIEWIDSNYPGLQYNDNTLGTTLSGIRKEMGGPGYGRRGRARPVNDPTAQELIKAKELVGSFGGVDALQDWLARAEVLVKEFGGLERVRICLDNLRRLQV